MGEDKAEVQDALIILAGSWWETKLPQNSLHDVQAPGSIFLSASWSVPSEDF